MIPTQRATAQPSRKGAIRDPRNAARNCVTLLMVKDGLLAVASGLRWGKLTCLPQGMSCKLLTKKELGFPPSFPIRTFWRAAGDIVQAQSDV